MPSEAAIYDLVLLLSTNSPEEERAKILADVETAISAGGGSVERNQDWGRRALAFRIDHQAEAEYHLLQLTGPPELLESLSHSLKIADGVLRFRIIKVIPGTPPPPDSAPPVIAVAPVPASAAAMPTPAAAVPVQAAVPVPATAEPPGGDGEAAGNGNGNGEPSA
jgi:small subunit ribosomal protein S6